MSYFLEKSKHLHKPESRWVKVSDATMVESDLLGRKWPTQPNCSIDDFRVQKIMFAQKKPTKVKTFPTKIEQIVSKLF